MFGSKNTHSVSFPDFKNSYTSSYILFTTLSGRSPISYYLDLKLNESKRLLREDNITVKQISEKLGFESPEYFSRYFKKRVGHSPRDFRKMLISNVTRKPANK